MTSPVRTALLVCSLLLAPLLAASVTRQASASSTAAPEVLLLDIKGGIGPATRDYIERGLKHADTTSAAAVVLRIDTPGGLDAATRDINQAILASPVPVIGWVAPEGARAASAGTYILYACHVAAMAPATSLGAATPISLGMPSPEGAPRPNRRPDDSDNENDSVKDMDNSATKDDDMPAPASAMERKARNDSIAYLRTLAELRGRDTAFAEAAVRDAATLTANQAVAQRVIDFIARDTTALLRTADGRTVRVHGGTATLQVTGAQVNPFVPDWRNRFLAVITEPTVAYLLLLIGVYGLVFEGLNPGVLFPGVIGGVSLLLALYALQVLPVNYAGVALIVLGVGLMAAEFAMPSFGSLGIGGVVALVAGSLMLFDTEAPGFGVPGRLIAGIAATSAAAFMGVVWLAMRARRQPVVSGVEELLGQTAIATEDFHEGRGQVHIRGELWQAHCATPVQRGQALRVRALAGLTLHVTPVEPES